MNGGERPDRRKGVKAIMGAARSTIEPHDTEKHQMVVELLGFPTTLTGILGADRKIEALVFLGERFERRAR